MISKKIIPGLLILLFILSCNKNPTEPEPQDILGKLQALPGIAVSEIEPHYGYPRAFQIDFTQPVDHQNANGQQFTQRLYLSHVDETMPMIFGPSGYGSSPEYVQELAGIMQTNHISVVHRYFINAEPEPLDWQYLTVKQSADDHHRIVAMFKQIYSSVWISSGRSKGGETVLFHRRFYPDDIDATIAYVAPMVFGTADLRFVDFLGSLGSDECWNRIHQFQRSVLENRDSLVTKLLQWFPDNGYTFSGDADMTLESAVRGYDWNFWQRHTYDCETIPSENASFDEMLTHLAAVVRMQNSSDELAGYYKPYVYQAFTEIGYPARNYDHLQDLLLYELQTGAEAFLESDGIELIYKPEVIQDVTQWLKTQGNNIIYIYGGADPWTGGAVELTGQTNAVKIIQAGADHGVKIVDLEQWLGIEIGQAAKRVGPIVHLEKKELT